MPHAISVSCLTATPPACVPTPIALRLNHKTSHQWPCEVNQHSTKFLGRVSSSATARTDGSVAVLRDLNFEASVEQAVESARHDVPGVRTNFMRHVFDAPTPRDFEHVEFALRKNLTAQATFVSRLPRSCVGGSTDFTPLEIIQGSLEHQLRRTVFQTIHPDWKSGPQNTKSFFLAPQESAYRFKMLRPRNPSNGLHRRRPPCGRA